MLKLNILQKLFFFKSGRIFLEVQHLLFLTPAATSKALIRRKTNREKSGINHIFTIVRNIYRSEKWKTPPESPETRKY